MDAHDSGSFLLEPRVSQGWRNRMKWNDQRLRLSGRSLLFDLLVQSRLQRNDPTRTERGETGLTTNGADRTRSERGISGLRELERRLRSYTGFGLLVSRPRDAANTQAFLCL